MGAVHDVLTAWSCTGLSSFKHFPLPGVRKQLDTAGVCWEREDTSDHRGTVIRLQPRTQDQDREPPPSQTSQPNLSLVPPPSSLQDTQGSVLTHSSHTAGSRLAEPRGKGWPAQSQAFPRNSRFFHTEIFSHQLTESGSHGEAELRNSSLFQNACTCVLVMYAEALAHPSSCLLPGHFPSTGSSPPSPFHACRKAPECCSSLGWRSLHLTGSCGLRAPSSSVCWISAGSPGDGTACRKGSREHLGLGFRDFWPPRAFRTDPSVVILVLVRDQQQGGWAQDKVIWRRLGLFGARAGDSGWLQASSGTCWIIPISAALREG